MFEMAYVIQAAQPAVEVVESVDIAPVWSGHEVGFALLTVGEEQYVGYYDVNRDMTLAKRKLGEKTWQIVKVPGEQMGAHGSKATPTRTGWDSHNYITLAVDAEGYLHLSGNLHNTPLLYFRSERPGDIASMKRIDRMVGKDETQVTYPRFLSGPGKELIFVYRQGGSGNGADYYNIYDTAKKSWSRLLDTPLTDGRSKTGPTAYAYARGPILGPDGYFHMVWVWRDNPDCSTNHSVSYARSKDLRNWENSAGKAIALPITPATSDVVDPVPAKGGMINNNAMIGFDQENKVIITYHKFDADGKTQIYNARPNGDGTWRSVQASKFDFRWEFSGGGSIIFEVKLGPVEKTGDGKLRQAWWTKKEGSGGVYLNAATLAPEGVYIAPPVYPIELRKPELPDPRVQTKWGNDSGVSVGKTRYVLRWEALPTNRDMPPEGSIPPPSQLRVYKLVSRG